MFGNSQNRLSQDGARVKNDGAGGANLASRDAERDHQMRLQLRIRNAAGSTESTSPPAQVKATADPVGDLI